MKKMKLAGLLLIALSLTRCNQKTEQIEVLDMEGNLKGIEETRLAFMNAVKESDGETIGKLVTSDAIILPPGSDDWQMMYAESKNQGPFPYDSILMFPKETVLVSDSVAYDFGVSHVYYTNNDGNVVELKDSFLVILKKDRDGTWRLHREVASSTLAD